MHNMLHICEMMGLSPKELAEIEKHQPALIAHKPDFFKSFEEWRKKYDVEETSEMLVSEDFYDSLISANYSKPFYRQQYHQALYWIEHGFSQGTVILMYSHFRNNFIHFAEKQHSTDLAKGMCHVVDIGQTIVANVYSIFHAIERMKMMSEAEVNRIQKTYELISAEIPSSLFQAYLDHQYWKQAAFNLALGREVLWEGFEVSHLHCRLAKWLNEGGDASIPADQLALFLEAHEKLHSLGQIAIEAGNQARPERVLDVLTEMENASDYVCRVLLDLINADFIRIATADMLTGLPNRRAFDADIVKQLAFAKRHDFWMSIVLLDIDYFKAINDEYGHSIGDKVLKMVAEIISQEIRSEEKAYRWGGEEFAILSIMPNEEGIGEMAERIRKAIEVTAFEVKVGQPPISLTISSGTVMFSGKTTVPFHEIFAFVDRLLYQAKADGRNRVVAQLMTEN